VWHFLAQVTQMMLQRFIAPSLGNFRDKFTAIVLRVSPAMIIETFADEDPAWLEQLRPVRQALDSRNIEIDFPSIFWLKQELLAELKDQELVSGGNLFNVIVNSQVGLTDTCDHCGATHGLQLCGYTSEQLHPVDTKDATRTHPVDNYHHVYWKYLGFDWHAWANYLPGHLPDNSRVIADLRHAMWDRTPFSDILTDILAPEALESVSYDFWEGAWLCAECIRAIVQERLTGWLARWKGSRNHIIPNDCGFGWDCPDQSVAKHIRDYNHLCKPQQAFSPLRAAAETAG